MKKTFLALALAAAAVPMTFAAQASGQANPPANSGSKPAATTTTKPAVKKHHKKAVKKSTTDKTSAAPAAVKPAPVAPVKK